MRINLFTAAALISLGASAQITLEQTFDSVQYGRDFYITDIGNNNSKYVFIDTASNSFSLLNLDGSPYVTGIATPDPIMPDYTVAYVTNSLFDCDSTTIEYAFMSYLNWNRPFRVLRTDGTILLQVESARGPVCYGCVAGTKEITPIVNTQEGAKLVLFQGLGPGVTRNFIYDLCGTLPVSNSILDLTGSEVMVKIYPNPAANVVIFEVVSLTNMSDCTLAVVNSQGQTVLSRVVHGQTDNIQIGTDQFSEGQYLYTLSTSNRLLYSGKFVVNR